MPTTILQVLQRENPEFIDHWGGVTYKNTTSTRFDDVTLDDGSRAHVQEWTDFTFGSIYAAYGDILDQQLGAPGAAYREVVTPSVTPRELIDENGIDTLGLVWSCNIERQPLKTAAGILRRRPGMATPAVTTNSPDPTLSSKNISWKHPTDAGASIKPDWIVSDRTISKKYGHAHSDDPAKALVYAVGDSKLKQKWKSSWLSLGDAACIVTTDKPYHPPGTPAPDVQKTKDVKVERINPLKQMATYCRYSETRYAYVVTQTELVAMRIRRIAGTGSRPTAAVEYRAIPWSAHGAGKLTAHLAIWALGCMGMNDSHRNTEGPNHAVLPHMARLTWWVEDKARKTFTNVISKRVLDAKDFAKIKASAALHTDDAGGKSLTRDFTAGGPPLPSASSVTQQMGNLTLGGKKPSSSTPPPSTTPTTQQKGKPPVRGAAPPAASASASKPAPKAYTKCKIAGKAYSLSKDAAGNYAAMEAKKIKHNVVKDAKRGWVVQGTTTIVQMEY